MSISDAKAVRRHAAQHDLFNRIHSISADEQFVQRVATSWFDSKYEVIANQRCGTWYCDPKTTSKQYAYFKSTDGHIHQWDFNLRRSNLALAEHAESVGGIILVDSTRRGKRMPDGLSKTVPVWCAVINSALSLSPSEPSVYLPAFISPSERSQINSLIPQFTQSLLSSVLPLPHLTKPLRPFFIHPSTYQPPLIPTNPDYTPIICLSASRFESNDVIPSATKIGNGFWQRTVGFEYVPGAGDDDELWARGLTPALYYANKDKLLSTPRDDLPSIVDSIVASTTTRSATTTTSASYPSDNIPDLSNLTISTSLDTNPSVTPVAARLALDIGPTIRSVSATLPDNTQTFTLIIVEIETKPPRFIEPVSETQLHKTDSNAASDSSPHPETKSSKRTFYLPSARTMPREYTKALSAIVTHLKSIPPSTSLILQPLNQTLSSKRAVIGLAVALLCAIPTLSLSNDQLQQKQVENGRLQQEQIDKSVVADKLHSIVALWPDGNPPRAALRRINEFLMSPLDHLID